MNSSDPLRSLILYPQTQLNTACSQIHNCQSRKENQSSFAEPQPAADSAVAPAARPQQCHSPSSSPRDGSRMENFGRPTSKSCHPHCCTFTAAVVNTLQPSLPGSSTETIYYAFLNKGWWRIQ